MDFCSGKVRCICRRFSRQTSPLTVLLFAISMRAQFNAWKNVQKCIFLLLNNAHY